MINYVYKKRSREMAEAISLEMGSRDDIDKIAEPTGYDNGNLESFSEIIFILVPGV